MHQYIAKTLTGLEGLLKKELEALGAKDLKIQKRGVSFTGTPRIMYRVNLESRLSLKVLQEIKTFTIEESQDVYTHCLEIEWEKFIQPGMTFLIDKDVFSSFFDNTMYAALICKDAVVDRIRDVRGERPSVEKKRPDVEISLFIREKSVIISLNSSGHSLHVRRYKKYQGIAPLNEVLAAGLIQLTGWDGNSPFLNPMCGSGTLLIEAQRLARNIPIQVNRKVFGFQKWPDFDEERWDLIVKGARMRINRNNPELIGFDSDPNAVKGAKENTRSAGCFAAIQIYNHDFFKYEPGLERATVIINPPYNVRLRVEDQQRFFNQINNKLYRDYKEYDNWLICPSDINLRKAGFRIEKEFTVYNGPIKCQFVKLSFSSKRQAPGSGASKPTKRSGPKPDFRKNSKPGSRPKPGRK